VLKTTDSVIACLRVGLAPSTNKKSDWRAYSVLQMILRTTFRTRVISIRDLAIKGGANQR
jgi:hypothetical protein